MQIRFPAARDGNFSFEKQIQLPRKRTFWSARALGDGLDAAKRLRAPRNDQARIAKFSFPQENGDSGFQGLLLARMFAACEVDRIQNAELTTGCRRRLCQTPN